MEPIAVVKALYAYEAREDNEVAFDEGEKLELLAKLEDDWWLVRKNTKIYGLAPSNYFEDSQTTTPVGKTSQMDIFSAILNAPEASYDEDPIEGYQAEIKQRENVRWIDCVDIRCAWPAKIVLHGDRRKGELVIGEDAVLGFVSGNLKVQTIN